MKNILILMIVALVGFTSCDPLGSKEPTTLPEMIFPISVSPDTAYIKLGDTIRIRTSISSQLNDSIKVTDGKVEIQILLAYSSETPITSSSSISQPMEGEVFTVLSIKGHAHVNPEVKKLRALYAYPDEDSLAVDVLIIPLKAGTYGLGLYSSFFEGSQGKARTSAFWDVENNHYDELRDIPGDDLGPGDYGYDNRYYFAVYE